ncbi:MAG TPA: lipid-binding SYLF domain-containing protein [Acetobacteraceae bacterium]|nr:lipid-binding SYLF domain-containing protein [Acetobacteraceae bacterium]
MTKMLAGAICVLMLVAGCNSGSDAQPSPSSRTGSQLGLGSAAAPIAPIPESNPPVPNGAVALTQSAAKTADAFFSKAQWQAIRNLTGGARGILIAPNSTSIGFIVGTQQGVGVLLTRHGEVWSDPVFVRLSNYDIGFLAGIAKSELMMLILTDSAVSQFIDGASKLSAGGGLAVGDWGAGGMGAGGISGGAQVMTVETSSGLFAGSGLGSMRLSLDRDLNAAAYGGAFDVKRTLAGSGGGFTAAVGLRRILAAAVRQSWGQ